MAMRDNFTSDQWEWLIWNVEREINHLSSLMHTDNKDDAAKIQREIDLGEQVKEKLLG